MKSFKELISETNYDDFRKQKDQEAIDRMDKHRAALGLPPYEPSKITSSAKDTSPRPLASARSKYSVMRRPGYR